MAYNPNIPNSSDFLSVSQAQMKNNFNDANTIFGFDHITFNASTNQGKHNSVTMPDLTTSLPTQAGVGFGQMVAVHNEFDVATQPRPTWNDNGGGIYYPMAPIVAYGAVTITGMGAGGFVVQQSFNCTITSLHTTNDQWNVALAPNLSVVDGFWYGVMGLPLRNQSLPTGSPTDRTMTVANQLAASFQLIFTQEGAASRPDGFSFIVIQF